MNNIPSSRRFFHSFPRPKKGESRNETLNRGLSILESMKQVGLVLAPEIVTWDLSGLGMGTVPLLFLQRRMSFTELAIKELSSHSNQFGPITLSLDIAKLRNMGATPVVYVPQGVRASPLSLIPIVCVNGVYHTKYVLSQLHELRKLADSFSLGTPYAGMPVKSPDDITLRNTGPTGNVVSEYKIPAANVREVLQWIGFNNIPFDHSAAVLGVFLSMFYPTDNPYSNDELGYYRQREWRIVAPDVGVKGRAITRALSSAETSKLEEIDPLFWTRELQVGGGHQRRSQLAVVFDPLPEWNLFGTVDEIFVSESGTERVKAIVGDRVRVRRMHVR